MKKISFVWLLAFGLALLNPGQTLAATTEGIQKTDQACLSEVCYDESPSAPDSTELNNFIRVTSPNGGETWGRKAGYEDAVVTGSSLHSINWDTLTVGVVSVDILYTLDSGLNWNLIASKVANTGTFSWILPNVDSTEAKIRVRGFDKNENIIGSDDSNSTFTILNYIVDPAYESDVLDDYHFQLVGVMAPITLKQGQMTMVNLTILNTGNATWHKYGNWPMHLGTTEPMDHASNFAAYDWLTPNRTAVMMEDEVKPGEVGTFQFTIFGNNLPGSYKEYFKPVAENLTWLNDELIVMNVQII